LALLSAALFIISFGHAHAQSAERAPDTVAARVLACASCHGDKGQGTNDDYFPRLAGKPAGYLYINWSRFGTGGVSIRR
jgi:cytochrome c553